MNELISNGLDNSIAQAIAQMKVEQGESFSLERINLAELERRTGISRGKLRRLKKNNFRTPVNTRQGKKHTVSKLTGYTGVIDSLLRQGTKNSSVCFERLKQAGYSGGISIVKEYILKHKYLIPAKRQQVEPQGNRGRRYLTDPGHTYQMDWGFTNVIAPDGFVYRVACFAMVCHYCGLRYIEFFPNAKQENLFIGMVHAFQYLGVPKCVLTDNMKSVVIRRDMEGHPIWQTDYETFMKNVGFETKLCKPRHPFTKGKVERLVRFVKDNFLSDRVFSNITDLNWQALEWCNAKNAAYSYSVEGIPQLIHNKYCSEQLHPLLVTDTIRFYLCPERKISFDGFINYEGRRFGVPYSYLGATARVMRKNDTLYIYSADLSTLLATHNVTWSYRDSFCEGQYDELSQPEEYPTMPVKVKISQLPKSSESISFEKFNFDEEDFK